MILYDAHHVAPAYAVRLLAGFLGLPLELQGMDVYPGHDDRSDEFLALNPLGTLPVLVDGDTVFTDWQEILAHLALAHGPDWYPATDPALVGWLGIARDLAASAGAARLMQTFCVPGDLAEAKAQAERLLDEVERRMWFAERAGHGWLLAGTHPTIADIAAFVSIAPCEDGGLSLRDRPALRRWCDRVRFHPGFVPMSGVFPPMANT
ncbi:glutathione S-transferase domain-containing protein [Novosphingobium nitrogenifigens DSM 19370]|uniref:Glutathione S-transferase domain-containing protein n=1 Tax=Novosphingobium nitrogenifigens DSM 19370 TaxID=983920 RepID=F1Z490_9SPHN|nr:glutathione S-transferase family protein [Novosphingobium nitrogenifigens]EGD60500.1 glutathione S-transferase domain-containing protein [Novosphingobium nitrogenifigens DSM 19370]